MEASEEEGLLKSYHTFSSLYCSPCTTPAMLLLAKSSGTFTAGSSREKGMGQLPRWIFGAWTSALTGEKLSSDWREKIKDSFS